MNKTTKVYLQNRAALFDWLVFIISFSMGFIFPSLGSFVLSPHFKWWMFGVLIAYSLGAWLKHLPLAERLSHDSKRPELGFYLFMITGHWVIFLVVIMMAEPAFSSIVGARSFMDNQSDKQWFIFPIMFLAGVVTWLVYRGKNWKKTKKVYSDDNLFWRELVADLLLITAVSILSFVIWEKGVMAMLSRNPVSSISDVWILFIVLCFAYVLCYLPLRHLFFIEERNSRKAWRRLLLIFGFLLLRSLFEILKIG